MDKVQLLVAILKRGLIEIRLQTSSSSEKDPVRINRLANILHNIPDALQGDYQIDIGRLESELANYQNTYKGNVFDYLSLFAESSGE